MIRLVENDKFCQTIKNKFICGMEDFGINAQIQHIDRCLFNARLETFTIYTKKVNEKTRSFANIRRAWFGASKDQIDKIILNGFSHDNIEKNGAFGCGLYLSSDNAIIERSVDSCP